MLTGHIKAHLDTLVAEQMTLILNTVGIINKINIIQTTPPDVPLSTVPQMDKKSIMDSVQSMESLLAESGTLMMPQCDRLLNSQLRIQARMSVNQLIFDSYLVFYNAITSSRNQVIRS